VTLILYNSLIQIQLIWRNLHFRRDVVSYFVCFCLKILSKQSYSEMNWVFCSWINQTNWSMMIHSWRLVNCLQPGFKENLNCFTSWRFCFSWDISLFFKCYYLILGSSWFREHSKVKSHWNLQNYAVFCLLDTTN